MKARKARRTNSPNFISRLRGIQSRITSSVAAHTERTRSFEQLEERHMLSAEGLQLVGSMDTLADSRLHDHLMQLTTTQVSIETIVGENLSGDPDKVLVTDDLVKPIDTVLPSPEAEIAESPFDR